jgi:hypothetical protein
MPTDNVWTRHLHKTKTASKIKRTATSPLYQSLRSESYRLGERNDCSVVAVAAVCGVSYADAHAALAKRGRKHKRGVYNSIIIDAVLGFSKTLERIDPKSIISSYPGIHKTLQNVTTHHPRRFPGSFNPSKCYLLFIKGHVLAVMGGEVNDWTINKAKRVIAIYEVK